MEEEKNIYKGIVKEEEKIYPAYINLKNSKYIEIDNLYYAGLICIDYYREQTDLILKPLIETNINMNISIFYEKQDSYKTIKDLTYHIGNVGVELKESNENRQDIDIAAFTYNDAKYIRKEMQINNEDLYFLYIYIVIYDTELKKLEYYLNKIEGITQSKGIQTKRANFREEEIFLSTLPFMENKEIIKEAARRNVLTSGLLATYPFISSTIFDAEGIFIGTNIYNNSMVFIDRYNTQKYKNANMCIFGTSGAGKSFYTKLLILRYKLLGIKQYIIDPDREYTNICKELGGTLIKIGPTSETYINILDIRKESIEEGEKGYLATKISKLIGFFNLIFSVFLLPWNKSINLHLLILKVLNIITITYINAKFKMVFIQAWLENTNWYFDMSAWNILATRKLVNWEAPIPIIIPTTNEIIPIINVSKNRINETFLFPIPNTR